MCSLLNTAGLECIKVNERLIRKKQEIIDEIEMVTIENEIRTRENQKKKKRKSKFDTSVAALERHEWPPMAAA